MGVQPSEFDRWLVDRERVGWKGFLRIALSSLSTQSGPIAIIAATHGARVITQNLTVGAGHAEGRDVEGRASGDDELRWGLRGACRSCHGLGGWGAGGEIGGRHAL